MVSRVWKEGRVLANLKKRSNMKAAMFQMIFTARHYHECFPCPHNNLEGGPLSPFIGEDVGPERESKLIKVTLLHSFEKDILYHIVSGTVQGNVNTWAKTRCHSHAGAPLRGSDVRSMAVTGALSWPPDATLSQQNNMSLDVSDSGEE